MGPLFMDGSIKKVFMPPCHHIFWPNAELIRTWLRNAGHIVVAAVPTVHSEVDVQIVFLPQNVHVLNPQMTPTVLVSTEQPASPRWCEFDKTFVTSIHTFWCMDIADVNFLRTTYDIPYHKLCIVPAMAGTYAKVRPARHVPTTIDVLHFGELNARRAKILSDIEDAMPGKHVVGTQNSWADVLTELIRTSRIVVVPHFWEEPNVLPVHRIMSVMQHPGVHVVVEESESSIYSRLLLQQFGDRIVFVKYEDIVTTVENMLRAHTNEVDDAIPAEPACIEKLYAWNGQTSWLDILSPDKFDVTSL